MRGYIILTGVDALSSIDPLMGFILIISQCGCLVLVMGLVFKLSVVMSIIIKRIE